jgi:hypothetical protein
MKWLRETAFFLGIMAAFGALNSILVLVLWLAGIKPMPIETTATMLKAHWIFLSTAVGCFAFIRITGKSWMPASLKEPTMHGIAAGFRAGTLILVLTSVCLLLFPNDLEAPDRAVIFLGVGVAMFLGLVALEVAVRVTHAFTRNAGRPSADSVETRLDGGKLVDG